MVFSNISNPIATKGKSMKSRILKSVQIAAVALAPATLLPAAPAAAQSVTLPAQDISLSIGNSQLISIPGAMADVFVANEAVADVQIKSARQFYVFGKGGGTTTVYASNAGGDIIWSANVRVGSNLDSVDAMLNLAMPEARIGVATMGTNTFLLTGTVNAPEDAAEAERLVQAFVGEGANVISRLRMSTPLQVNLRVRIAEVSRSFVRAIGVNLNTHDATDGFKFGVSQGREFTNPWTVGGSVSVGAPAGQTVVTQISPGSTLAGFGKFLGLDLAGALDLGETEGLVATLAQPNLTALSGETAEFLAGGEYPIPVSQGLGSTSVEYKKYGVSLSYTPTVLANGRISLRVRPEVSELSTQGSVQVGAFSVPALTVRRAETTVELGSGQSFMIAGLMSNNSQNAIDKTPGLGSVPILGALFRSTNYRRGESELVIVVTPYLVRPVNDSDIKLPTDGYMAPNELERIWGLKDTSGNSGGERPGPTAAPSAATNPDISAADPAESSKSEKESKKRDHRVASDVPAPGFSLK